MSPAEISAWAAAAAAAFSLVAAVLTVVGGLWIDRRVAKRTDSATRKEQYRALLQPHVPELSAILYEIVASAQVAVHKQRQGASPKAWRNRASESAQVLKSLWTRLRYPLAGIDEGLRQMVRVPGWLAHKQGSNGDGDADLAQALVQAADELRAALDAAIISAYVHGEPPTKDLVTRVETAKDALIAAHRAADPSLDAEFGDWFNQLPALGDGSHPLGESVEEPNSAGASSNANARSATRSTGVVGS